MKPDLSLALQLAALPSGKWGRARLGDILRLLRLYRYGFTRVRRSHPRHLAAGLLMISAVTRLIAFWISQLAAGIADWPDNSSTCSLRLPSPFWSAGS
jgi:hypothetical protein